MLYTSGLSLLYFFLLLQEAGHSFVDYQVFFLLITFHLSYSALLVNRNHKTTPSTIQPSTTYISIDIMKVFAIIPLLLAVASARTIHIYRRADNLQTFTGSLGAAAPAVTNSGDSTRPFEVNGDTFVKEAAALQRSCDVQFNACANKANSGASFTVDQCQQQKSKSIDMLL